MCTGGPGISSQKVFLKKEEKMKKGPGQNGQVKEGNEASGKPRMTSRTNFTSEVGNRTFYCTTVPSAVLMLT